VWCAHRAKLVAALAAAVAILCALVLASEAARGTRASAWREASAGLGLGARAGAGGGFFAYDARLETQPEGRFAPFPGAARVDGPGGALDVPALERPREPGP